MNTIHRSLRMPIVAAALAAALTVTTRSARAIDPPPQSPPQERAWLAANLTTDMQAVGAFDAATIAQVPGLIGSVSDAQANLVAQYFYLLRGKAEADAYLYSLEQQGLAGQFDAAQAQAAETQLSDQIAAVYNQIAAMPPAVQVLAQYIYASVPGWCCDAGYCVPEWYFVSGCYVGPCRHAVWAGPWAAPLCKVWFDRGSHFYAAYHRVGDKVRFGHSASVARFHLGAVHVAKPVVHEVKVRPVVRHEVVRTHEVKRSESHAAAVHTRTAKPTVRVEKPTVHTVHARSADHKVAHAVAAGRGKHR